MANKISGTLQKQLLTASFYFSFYTSVMNSPCIFFLIIKTKA